MRQSARERVPAIAGQHAGAQQDRGGEAVRVLGRPAQAPRPAEVVHDQVGAVDGEGVERPADEGGVRVHGLAEPGRRARAAEAGRVPGHGPPALSDSGQQRFPVGARAGVAMHEHDGLGCSGGPGLAQRGAHAADVQLACGHDARSRRTVAGAAGRRGPSRLAASTRAAGPGRSSRWGRSIIATTLMKASASAGSRSAAACRRRR